MSKAQRKARMIKLVVAEDHLVITRDDVARRAYELFLARGQGEGHEVEDCSKRNDNLKQKAWPRQSKIEPPIAGDSPNRQP